MILNVRSKAKGFYATFWVVFFQMSMNVKTKATVPGRLSTVRTPQDPSIVNLVRTDTEPTMRIPAAEVSYRIAAIRHQQTNIE